MTRTRLTTLSIALLLAPTPIAVWKGSTSFGLPTWAFVVLAASLVYAVGIAWLLGRYWDLMAEASEEQTHP